MTKFRVGDVVRFPNDEPGNERVVDLVGDDRIRCADGWWHVVSGDFGPMPALLRRPVRVGDVLAIRDGMQAVYSHVTPCRYFRGPCTVEAQEEPRRIEGRWGLHGIWLEYLTHADGTPIDLPREAETPAERLFQAAARVDQIETLAGVGAISAEDARHLKQQVVEELDKPRTATQGAGTMAAEGAASGIGGTSSEKALSGTEINGGAILRRWEEETARIAAVMMRQQDAARGQMYGIDRAQEQRLAGMQAHRVTNAHVAQGLARAAQQETVRRPPPLPTADQLARALFETDERVVAFVQLVGDAWRADENVWSGPGNPRTDAALRRAYARGIFGYAPETEWTRDAWSRAEQILDVLRGMK